MSRTVGLWSSYPITPTPCSPRWQEHGDFEDAGKRGARHHPSSQVRRSVVEGGRWRGREGEGVSCVSQPGPI